jgi:predicted HicB family RNase H-like nuclease
VERAVLLFTLKPGKEQEAEALNAEFEPRQREANAKITGLHGWDKFVLKGKYVDVIDYEGSLDDVLAQAGQAEAHQQFLERMHPLIEETREEVSGCFMKRISHYAAAEQAQ